MADPAREPDYATTGYIEVLRAEMNALRTETRAEMSALRTEMNAGFAELRGEMRSAIATVETRTMRTLYAVGAALLAGQVASVFALIRLFG